MARPYGVNTDLLCPDCASSEKDFPKYPRDQVGQVRCSECQRFLVHLGTLSVGELDELSARWPELGDVKFSTICADYDRRGISLPQ